MKNGPSIKRGIFAAFSILGLWVVATFPAVVIGCSSPGGPYASGLASWQLLSTFASVVIVPGMIIVGTVAALVNVQIPPTLIRSRAANLVAPVALLAVGGLSCLTAHPGQPNCFP